MNEGFAQSVLVTGATGFLGGALVARLLAEGRKVFAHGRRREALDGLARSGAIPVEGDLADPEMISRLAALGPVDAIVHAAARSAATGPKSLFERDNVTATAHLLTAAERMDVRRFVYISSPSVGFAPRDQIGLQEADPLPPPYTAYAASKRWAEDMVLARGELGPIVLRPRGLYGRGDAHLLPRLLAAARRGPLPLFRGGAGRIDLTHVDDAVRAIGVALTASEPCVGGVFNISSGEVLPVREIVDRAGKCAGVAIRWRALPLGPCLCAAGALERGWLAVGRQGEPPITRYGLALLAYAQSLDLSEARERLGWVPEIGFGEGLERTFEGGAP